MIHLSHKKGKQLTNRRGKWLEYKGYGTVTVDVSKSIDAEDEKEAVRKLYERFGTYGISKVLVKVVLEDGSVHELKVNDHEVDWVDVDEMEEKEKSLSDELNDQNK
jgi:predicted ATP-grasp superfamily ATP-dependent carboligase